MIPPLPTSLTALLGSSFFLFSLELPTSMRYLRTEQGQAYTRARAPTHHTFSLPLDTMKLGVKRQMTLGWARLPNHSTINSHSHRTTTPTCPLQTKLGMKLIIPLVNYRLLTRTPGSSPIQLLCPLILIS